MTNLLQVLRVITSSANELVQVSQRYSRRLMPISILLVVSILLAFVVFVCEGVFEQLRTSKSIIELGNVSSELNSIKQIVNDLETREKSYQLLPNNDMWNSYNESVYLLAERMRDINTAHMNDLNSQRYLSDINKAVQIRSDFAQKLLDRERLTKTLPSPAELAELKDLTVQLQNKLSNIIDTQTTLHNFYLQKLQGASLTNVIYIGTFRAVTGIILCIALLLMQRYFTEKHEFQTLLQGIEKKFRAVLDQTFQFSCILSPEGKLEEFNRTSSGFPEIDAKHALGKPIWDVAWWHPLTAQSIQEAVAKAARGEYVRFEEEIFMPSGTGVFDFSVRPVIDDHGQINMMILEARDITSRKQAEQASIEKAARLSAIFDTAADGIFTLRPDGQIETANAAFRRTFGYANEEIIGKNITTVLPDFLSVIQIDLSSPPAPGSSEQQVLRTGIQMTGKKQDGSTIPVEFSISMLNLGDHQILTSVVRDITERREAEKHVKDFYSNVSHELRTPLTSIRTALGLIEEGAAGALNQEAIPILQIAQSESDRLIRLINDMLDIRTIEEGKLALNYSSVSVKDLVHTAIEAVSAIAHESKVKLVSQIDEYGPITCDEDRIIQVLTNLLSNAIKYSPSEETVLLSTSGSAFAYTFSVTDYGPGISIDQAHRLFGRFEQLYKPEHSKTKGTGLGLAISKAIVEQHGGKIGVDRDIKRGCRFWFEIPQMNSIIGQSVSTIKTI